MSFKVNINKEYFHKVLEISEGKYSPDEKRIHILLNPILGKKIDVLSLPGRQWLQITCRLHRVRADTGHRSIEHRPDTEIAGFAGR